MVSTHDSLCLAVTKDSTPVFKCKIFSGLLVPGTSASADRELRVSMFSISLDRRVVADVSPHMKSGGGSSSGEQCRALVY